MHYGEIILADSANGPGIRVSLFVSGCTNRCPGCFQPETWDFAYGKPYTKEAEDFILEEVSHNYYTGLTILGGEPMEQENQPQVLELVRRMRRECPDKTIWIYTGFVYERDLAPGGRRYYACTDELMDSIDVLVDGRFMEQQKNISLPFRGSENQRILDMPRTRQAHEPVWVAQFAPQNVPPFAPQN